MTDAPSGRKRRPRAAPAADQAADQATEIREAHAELDRAGAAPDMTVPRRIRQLVHRQTLETELALVAERAVQEAESGGGVVGKDGPPQPPIRHRLPDERKSITHHFSISALVGERVIEVDGYITAGLYPSGAPGELAVKIAGGGPRRAMPALQGTVDAWAVACSLLLQQGTPLRTIVYKFRHWSFEPSGRTSNPAIPIAASIIDYVARWLWDKFGEEPPAGSEPIMEGA